MIVVFSAGFTKTGRDGFPKYDDIRSVIDRAARSGVVIYAIDGRALSVEDIEHEKHDALFSLTRETGGEFYQNTNDLSGAVGRAFDANRYYYILAYYLKPESRQRFRNISVREHPEYRVRTIRGFSPGDLLKKKEEAVQAETTPRQRLIRFINQPLETTDLGVSARMDFTESGVEGQQVLLTIHFEGNKLHYRPQGKRHAFTVEILYVVYNSSGGVVEASSAEVEGNLTAERMAIGRARGYLFSKELKLKPGTYQARVGVRELSTDLTGTSAAWIEVPDLKRDHLALSSLLLLDLLRPGDNSTENRAEELNQIKMVRGIPLYPRNRICGYIFRVFRSGKARTGSKLAMKTDLLLGSQTIRETRWLPLAPDSAPGADQGKIYVGGKVDLAGLKPGLYELRVSVRDGKKTARQTALLGVE